MIDKKADDLAVQISQSQIRQVQRDAQLIAEGQAGVRALKLLKERGSLTMEELCASFEDWARGEDPFLALTGKSIVDHLRPFIKQGE